MSEKDKHLKFTHRGSTIKVVPEIPLFPTLLKEGFLDSSRESSALFYYYLCAQSALEETDFGLVYEGELEGHANYEEMIKSIAHLYNVQVSGMTRAWPLVDKVCIAKELPILPKLGKYRHNSVIELR